jgi:hypothetical protein
VKRIIQLTTLAALAAFATGCFTINASVPGTVRGDIEADDYETVGSFEHEVNHWFIPCGLGEAPEAEFRKEMLKAAKEQGADGVANVKFEAYNGCMDIIIGGLCPILAPRTFKMSGDLVRIKKPPLPGNKPTDAPPGGQVTVDNDKAEEPEIAVAY